ncbi:hypothetical protein OHS33_39540 (plasmid) [Streptomyces sp. NBC_00536]|uniref:hypothetical protein n=1 Tax=Streptomyces sp. NBC_00536 TaxID=2975769 RepID=UPI002E81228A|nr:hypothetical protein [Streptomyces sp. NBC_00536]WUC84461.1 hypothetical protein OHS33_39540 [Streptomyces sp. NBC_00536]
MDETNDQPDERARPPALTPVDEAMLARAHTLMQIVEAGLRDVSERYRDDDHGRVLRDALFIQGLADDLVTKAVIAERERGASWTAIGNAADISRQSAHERWNTKVAAWVLMGRQRSGIGRGEADPATHAQYLGEWLDALVGKGRDAISRLLPSLSDPAARQEANDRRAEVKRLEQRAEELGMECEAAYHAAMAAAGTDAAEEKRAVWAAKHFARAEVFERLAVIEEPAAADRRRRAAQLRAVAEGILRQDGLDSETRLPTGTTTVA